MTNVIEIHASANETESRTSLDALCLEGAPQMLNRVLELEVEEYLERHHARDEEGRAVVDMSWQGSGSPGDDRHWDDYRRSPSRPRDRRVDDQGERQRFTSAILPPYTRRSPMVAEVLPVLYLHGLSTGDFC